MRKLILLTFILLNICVSAAEKEMGTKYFRFIYDENYETEATELAESVDVIAEKLFNFFDFIPPEKIVVVFRDNNDEENAYAIDNTIFLFPNSINTFELEKTYDDWYVYAFTHELAHVVINRKVGGVFSAIPFFKYNLHQAFMPSWYHEGLAVYCEVEFNEDKISGRELSKKFEMYIKDDVLHRKFEGLTFANGYYFNKDNYTHGYSFIKFFVDTYGEEALHEVIEQAASHQIMQPFEAFLDVADVNTEEEMYRLWLNYLNNQYLPSKNVREGSAIANISKGTKKNLLIRNGELYYSNFNESIMPEDYSEGIYKFDMEKNEETEIVASLPVNGFDVFNDNLYYSTLFYDYEPMTYYAESYKVKKKKKKYLKPKHLNFERAINFVYLDDELAYVFREKEKLGLRTSNGKLLIAPKEEYLFQKFYYDELNQYIYFAATKVNEKISWIYEFNMETYEIKKIVKGYSPFIEGDELYFDNSKDGVFNIFKYNFESQDIVQLTNARLGAFEPQVMNNELYFLNYSNDNFSVNKLNPDRYYNRQVDMQDFDEKEVVEEKKKEVIERAFDVEDLKRRRFKNNFSYRYGYLIPGEIALTFSDQLWENFVTVGVSSFLHGNTDEESDTGVYFGTQSYTENTGLIAAYENNLVNIYAELTGNTYAELNYEYPILGKDHESWFFAELSLNTKAEKTLGVYANKDIFFFTKEDNIGIRRTFDTESSGLNEIYVENSMYALRLFFAEEDRTMNGALNDDYFISLSGFDFNQIRYNIQADKMILANAKFTTPYPVYEGSVSGTVSVRNYFTSLDMYAIAWAKNQQYFVYDASVGGDGFIFTHLPVTLSTGLLGQVDLNEFNFVDGSGRLYIKYKMEF